MIEIESNCAAAACGAFELLEDGKAEHLLMDLRQQPPCPVQIHAADHAVGVGFDMTDVGGVCESHTQRLAALGAPMLVQQEIPSVPSTCPPPAQMRRGQVEFR